MVVQYEDLVLHTEQVLEEIASTFSWEPISSTGWTLVEEASKNHGAALSSSEAADKILRKSYLPDSADMAIICQSPSMRRLLEAIPNFPAFTTWNHDGAIHHYGEDCDDFIRDTDDADSVVAHPMRSHIGSSQSVRPHVNISTEVLRNLVASNEVNPVPLRMNSKTPRRHPRVKYV